MGIAQRVPDLGALELLLAVVRLGSVGRAAAELGVTQPAASARISALEQRLGLALLDRSPRGSLPTEAGTLLAGWAQQVVTAATALDAGAAALRDRDGDRLRVVASRTVAEHLMPGWLVALDGMRPGTSVALRTAAPAAVAETVRAGAADLGFVEGARTPAGLSGTVVASDRLVVVVAPGHPWARRRGVDGGALAATPLILRAEGSGTREVLDRALAAHGGTAPPLLEPASTAALKAAVLAGAAPGVVSERAVAAELAGGRLVPVPVADLDLHRPLRAVWPAGRRPAGTARDLVGLARRSRP
ncbi:HTH-type transcriptional regulator CysL [Actinomadura rubteroloni]|uniref:HTH-type transcriptional regulator CysL n=1 Tax=Actinomadura rubteroloni TaxID=1926885 RepID=A0A2P4UFD8_9ACTN|nr:LysR family transcriptional regulator [Actinomadura rubteroloni]POM23787.1 HTH-type transcriptional regulator CysL [Actinomadura rubteroloni]